MNPIGTALALQRLTAALSGALTRDAIARVVLDEALPAFGAAVGWLMLRVDARGEPDAAGERLRLVGALGVAPPFAAAMADVPLTEASLTAQVARLNAPRCVDVDGAVPWAARYPASAPFVAAHGLTRLCALPLDREGTSIGALGLGFRDARTVTPAQRDTMAAVAAQCALALERARLFEAERAARARVEELNAELRRAVADLEAVLAVVPIGIGITDDPACRDIRVNPAFARHLGIAPSANASKSGPQGGALPFRVLRDGREVPADELPMQRAARDGVTLTELEFDVQHADGRVVRLLEYAAPLRDEAGAPRGAVGVFVDITERARLVEAERQARAEAERANRAKSEFLAVMSHELRTPLNAIDGYAELLELGIRGPVTEQQREDLARIRRSQRHLLGLINEVLNYARLETAGVRFDLAPVDVAGVVAAVEGLVLPQLRARGLTLDRRGCPPGLLVLADAEKLRQILVNLLSNAVKFTDPGGRITVSCAVEPAGAADGRTVAIAVADTGIGIPDDKLETVFEPFVQIGRALNRPTEGTGLGLAISRDLARGMGGELTATSEPGVGSVFRLRLPAG